VTAPRTGVIPAGHDWENEGITVPKTMMQPTNDKTFHIFLALFLGRFIDSASDKEYPFNGQDCANWEDPVQDSHLAPAHKSSLQFIIRVRRESQAHILARLPFRPPFRSRLSRIRLTWH